MTALERAALAQVHERAVDLSLALSALVHAGNEAGYRWSGPRTEAFQRLRQASEDVYPAWAAFQNPKAPAQGDLMPDE